MKKQVNTQESKLVVKKKVIKSFSKSKGGDDTFLSTNPTSISSISSSFF
ncbi:hypothetical protein [Chryseobacterium sp. GM_Chr_1]|nr:hypothetical protein [Chryseobacterium sp. GM_Chr_1]